ncbi:MAG: hypothetical protein ACYTF1_11870 [Planctomycetota bacterium]|jgi:hypothetical protein
MSQQEHEHSVRYRCQCGHSRRAFLVSPAIPDVCPFAQAVAGGYRIYKELTGPETFE